MEDISHLYPEIPSLTFGTHVAVRTLSSVVDDAVEGFLAKFNISSGRFLILMVLEFNTEGLKPSQIANNLGITQATVTGLIDGLRDSGLVDRKEHHMDRRACVITLTESGLDFIRTVRPQFNRWVSSIYAVWNETEMKQVIGLIERMTNAMSPIPATKA